MKKPVKKPVKKQRHSCFKPRILFALLSFVVCSAFPRTAPAQAVPYSHTYSKSKEEIDKALKEFQSYSGQKLPIVDGFVAPGDQSLDRYQRAYYQFSIDLVPGTNMDSTTVHVSAKITAWYDDPDPSKSAYQVLPSNGRLELDLLDRLTEKFGGRVINSVLSSAVQTPSPKTNLSGGSSGISLPPKISASPSAGTLATPAAEEATAMLTRRRADEKRMVQLNAELQSLQDIQRNQANPRNLVVVKKSGVPVLARPAEGSRLLFAAAADDEFEFLDAEGEWIHVQISGASRGYIRRGNLDLPEFVSAQLKSQNGTHNEEKSAAFRIEREENSPFPGDWEPLKGKTVKIYSVQPVSQDSKDTGARAKLAFADALFRKYAADTSATAPALAGIVVIFDSADGGMMGATVPNVRQFAEGTLSAANFWKQCYLDPPDAFQESRKP